MVLGNRFWGWSGIGRQCEARVPSGRGGVGRLLFRRRGRLGRGDKTVPHVPAGGDLFRLGSVPGSAWAQVSRQLRVDERDRIIPVATISAEVAQVSGDDFGFREALGELERTISQVTGASPKAFRTSRAQR